MPAAPHAAVPSVPRAAFAAVLSVLGAPVALALSLPVFLSAAAPSAAAEVAKVLGGEHAAFTRLVVEARGLGDWRLGRGPRGYELDAGAAITGFDLSRAFDRIARDRISGLWRDPASGRLKLQLSCACHAIAFEFRPGIVVIDIRPGAAPPGSSFEDRLPAPPPDRGAGPEPASASGAASGAVPMPGGYDWLDEWFARGKAGPQAPGAGLPDVAGPEFGALREALLAQISRGVSEGVVSVADPLRIARAAAGGPSPGGPGIALGDLPAIAASTPHSPAAPYSDSGLACIEDAWLDIGSWFGPEESGATLAAARARLIGEFDRPLPAAVLEAARTLLSLSFGLEARQVLGFLPGDGGGQGGGDGGGHGGGGEDAALLLGLSYLVDLESPPGNPFAGMQSCDGAAALWASLALAVAAAAPIPAGPVPANAGAPINGGAVALAFSALPLHLRRSLGPALAGLALERGQPETARLIRDAMLRDGSPAGPGVMLADARYRLAAGDAPGGAALAARVLADGGTSSAEAAALLAEAAFLARESVPAELPRALAAFVAEARGTPREPGLRRALALSLAMTGDHSGAFAAAAGAPELLGDLWTLAARGADDAAFLRAAFGGLGPGRGAAVPDTDADTGLAVALRLVELGFPERALRWLGAPRGPAGPEARRLAARAALALGDARGALEALAGLGDAEAEILRGQAHARLGDNRGAALAFGRASDPDARETALRLAEAWPDTDLAAPTPWAEAAALAVERPGAAGRDPDLPVLAGMRELAGTSERAREAALALLDSLRAPP